MKGWLVESRSNEQFHGAAILGIKFVSDRLFISTRLPAVSDTVYPVARPALFANRCLNACTAAVVNSFDLERVSVRQTERKRETLFHPGTRVKRCDVRRVGSRGLHVVNLNRARRRARKE